MDKVQINFRCLLVLQSYIQKFSKFLLVLQSYIQKFSESFFYNSKFYCEMCNKLHTKVFWHGLPISAQCNHSTISWSGYRMLIGQTVVNFLCLISKYLEYWCIAQMQKGGRALQNLFTQILSKSNEARTTLPQTLPPTLVWEQFSSNFQVNVCVVIK